MTQWSTQKKDSQGKDIWKSKIKTLILLPQAIRSYYQMDEPVIDRITEAITEPVKYISTSQTHPIP